MFTCKLNIWYLIKFTIFNVIKIIIDSWSMECMCRPPPEERSFLGGIIFIFLLFLWPRSSGLHGGGEMGRKDRRMGGKEKGEQVWGGKSIRGGGFLGRSKKRSCQERKKSFFSVVDLKLGGSSKWGVLGGGKAERDLREEAQVWPRIFFSFMVFVSLHYFHWDNP